MKEVIYRDWKTTNRTSHSRSSSSSSSSTSSSTSSTSTSSVSTNDHSMIIIPPTKDTVRTNTTDKTLLAKIYWQNMFIAFEFLSKGETAIENIIIKLKQIEDPKSAKSEKDLKSLESSVSTVKRLINPIDPTDKATTSDWKWNLNSIRQYKLFKLKYSLVMRIETFLTRFKTFSPPLFTSITHSKQTMEERIKIHVINRLFDYITRWKLHLEKVNKDYKDVRIRNSPINDSHSLKHFLVLSKTDNRETIDNEANDLDIDNANSKFLFILDILIDTTRGENKECNEFEKTLKWYVEQLNSGEKGGKSTNGSRQRHDKTRESKKTIKRSASTEKRRPLRQSRSRHRSSSKHEKRKYDLKRRRD